MWDRFILYVILFETLLWQKLQILQLRKVRRVQLIEVNGLSYLYDITLNMKEIDVVFTLIVFSDAVLAQVATEKRLALIKAWEESEKTKVENK